MPILPPPDVQTSALGTRTVIGPDGSIYSAGPQSQYNADPTQIPANPLPPIRPPPSPQGPADYLNPQAVRAEARLMMPNAQTEADVERAIDAATRYQARRAFDQAVERGMPREEAWLTFAPSMFGGSKGPSLGQFASFMKAIRPPTFTVPRGGQVYQRDSTGRAVPLTPPPAPAEARNGISQQIRMAEVKDKLAQKKALEDQLDNTPEGSPEALVLQQKRGALVQDLKDMEQGGTAPTASRRTPVGTPAPAELAPDPRATGTGAWGSPAAPSASAAPPKVTSKAEFEALAPGTIYIGKNGKKYRKPADYATSNR